MDFRFVAYDPQTGTKLYQLPRSNSVNIGDTFGTRGTLELTYSAKAINARDLPTFLEVQAEVTFDQGDTWAPAGPSLLRLSGEHEDTDQAGMRTLRFVGREWVLGKARVGAGDLELIDGKRPFYRASPGQILRTLILEAQDRGAADGIEIGNFTAAKDSSGKAWAKVATIYYSPGLPIGSVLENLVEQGMCDYRMNGRTIELFDPETTMGRDLTTGGNPVRVHGAVTEAPVKYTLEDLANSALLMGDEGFELEVDNPTAPDDYGRLEVTIEQGGVSDSGTARLMVDEALHRGSREVREITRSQSAAGAAYLPFRDYRVGDFVQVHTGGEWERYRVREIQLARDGQEWTIHTVINDRLQELLLKLAKRTSGIVNGSKGSGGDGTRPTPPEKPGIEPAAPEGLVIDQQVYLDRQGIARGQITAGWGAVTESTKGQNVEIGGYELWTRRNETHASWVRAASTDGDLTATHSPVVLSDADGNALEYQWRVRAIAQASNRPGPWSDTVTLTMTQDTEPPSVPSLPVVETDLRIVTVDVDGLDEFGEAMPVDFNHLRIYFAAAEDMAGAERVGSLTQRGTWTSGSMPADVPVWVAVSAVDNVGNESAMTPAQSVTPKKLVDDDSIRDAVDGIDDKINTAVDDLNQAIDNIVVDANGTTTYWMPTEPNETTDPKPKTGDLWFDTSTAGKNKLHRFDGASWASAADERIDTIDQAQADLEADVDRVRTSVDGKNAVTQSTSTPPNQYDGTKGDIWEIMSSMGSGGRSVSRWRWNGTVWVSNLIGDTVLGNVDAAKIGTGYLDADRIESHSLTADKVLIGIGTDLIADGGFNSPLGDGWKVWTGASTVWSIVSQESGANYLEYMQSGGGWKELYSDPSVRVVPGQEFLASVSIRLPEPWAASYPRVSAFFFGEDGTRLSAPIIMGAEPSVAGWQELSGSVTAPAGAVSMSFVISTPSSATDGSMAHFRDPTFRLKSGATLIEDGAITTDKIATGAITADSAIIESINAGVITSGQMSGDRIEANSISADKVLIGGSRNLIPNGEFETGGAANWPTAASYRESYGPPDNGPAPNLTFPDGNVSHVLQGLGEWAVQPGEILVFEVSIKTEVDGSKVFIEMSQLEADVDSWARLTGWVDMEGGVSHSQGPVLGAPGADWKKLISKVEIPSGVHRVRINRMETSYPGGPVSRTFIGGMRLYKQVGATLIQDGAITTDKILANAITAGKIAALAIEADHISANAITADKINAGAIDGKLITGARIRTAASGARVELNSEGLKAYRSNGAVVLNTDTSDGSIDMLGTLTTSSGQSDSVYSVRVGDKAVTATGYGAVPGVAFLGTGSSGYREGSVFAEKESVNLSSPTLASKPGSVIKAGSTGIFGYVNGRGPGTSGGDDIAIGNNGQWNIGRPGGSGWSAWGSDSSARFGSNDSTAPYLYLRKGPTGTGYFKALYKHPSLDKASSMLSLEMSEIYLSATNSYGNLISQLWGDNDSTRLTAGTRSLYLRGKDVSVNADSKLYFPGLPPSSSAVPIGRDGNVCWISSSRKSKLIEEPIESTVESFEDRLLSVDAKTWVDRGRAEMIADQQTAIVNGQDHDELPEGMGGLERIPGVVAEDMIDAGLELFVHFDESGDPMAVMYDRIGPALIPIIRRLRDRVDALETKLGATA